MSFSITVLGSGSRGNSTVVGVGGLNLLIDAGFSRAELLRRLSTRQISPESIQAVLLTHEHDDHLKGAKVFCDTFNIPLYLTTGAADFLRDKGKLPKKLKLFSAGDNFKVAGYSVRTFAVMHDATDAVGFVIEHGEDSIGLASDLGVANSVVEQNLHDCSALLIESNYDMTMLRESNRSFQLKRRILSQVGHMHNLDTMKLLPKLLTKKTKKLFFIHVSQDCNCYNKVAQLGKETLSSLGREDIEMLVARQDEPLKSVHLNAELAEDLLVWAEIGGVL